MSSDFIELTIDGAVATIALNRPEALNACSRDMFADLETALDTTDLNDDVRCVVITGRGRAFCAGADLGGGVERFRPERDSTVRPEASGQFTLRLYRSLKPVVVAINGAAVGAGLTMTLAADVRLAAEGARFALPFTRRGITPDGASSWFLSRIVGVSRAVEWAVTGRTFDTTEALAAGLVHSVHPTDELLSAAYQLAAHICSEVSPVSASLTRRLIWAMLAEPDPAEAHRLESLMLHVRGASADAREGVGSFLEKRSPAFSLTVPQDLPDIPGLA